MKRSAWYVGLATLLLGCGSPQKVAGTGSQTGNSVVAGRVVLADSLTGAAGVPVFLRPIGWTRSDSATLQSVRHAKTDSLGYYRFDSVPLGGYRIEARDAARGWTRTLHAAGLPLELPKGFVQPFGSLRVELDPVDTILGGRLEIYGLDKSIAIPSSSTTDFYLRLDSLPPGLHTVRIWARHHVVCDAPVRILPGATTELDFEEIDLPPGGPRDDD